MAVIVFCQQDLGSVSVISLGLWVDLLQRILVAIESGVRDTMEKRSKLLHIFVEYLLLVDKVESFSSPVLFNYIQQPNKQGCVLYNCDETVDREEDHDGGCKDVFFYHDKDMKGLVLGEVGIYTNCLEVSCAHEYHPFLMTKSSGQNVLLLRTSQLVR